MERLIEGYRRFRRETWPAERARYEHLASRGQKPGTLVIACSDSRVDPQTIFGAGPGELFVVRNVAAIVPPYRPDQGYHGTSAAVEYAVRVLEVSRIVVLGHALCGGVRAMIEGAPGIARDFIEPWLNIARRELGIVAGAQAADDDLLERYEAKVVGMSVANLATFPWIAGEVSAGRMQLHGMRFDIRSGVLSRLDGGELVPVA